MKFGIAVENQSAKTFRSNMKQIISAKTFRSNTKQIISAKTFRSNSVLQSCAGVAQWQSHHSKDSATQHWYLRGAILKGTSASNCNLLKPKAIKS